MNHSHEEIRDAAFAALAGNVHTPYALNQFAHLEIAVAKALKQDTGNPTPHPGFPQHDARLSTSDGNALLEIFWDLFRQGVITLGLDKMNPQFPWFHLTPLGQSIVSGNQAYFIHDVSVFEKRIRKEIPKIDDVTLLYLKEALQAFRSECILSATVMLGVATEHTFLLLLETIEKSSVHQPTFASVTKERTLLHRLNKFKHILDGQIKSLTPEIREDLDTNFAGILSIIRNFRNESGHPSGKIIDREQAYVLLQLFLPYCKKMYQLREHYK
jgi:hypothetical protein